MGELAATARGCWMLILAEARDKGFVRDTPNGWDLQPGMKELARFMTVERSALQALGLERRQKDFSTMSLVEYLDATERAEAHAPAHEEAERGPTGDGSDSDIGRE